MNGISLFGSGRIKSLADWPLLVRTAEPSTFSLATEWTLAAGGDVNLDRSGYVKAVQKGYGPDYPWSGGYAQISGYRCCSFDGASSLAVVRPTTDPGALARRFSQADLALVNLEGPAPNDFVYRPASLVFLPSRASDSSRLAWTRRSSSTAQVALLDPAGDGHRVLDAIRRASRGLLGW